MGGGGGATVLPYSDKMTFLVNEQNVSVMYNDINAMPYLDLIKYLSAG